MPPKRFPPVMIGGVLNRVCPCCGRLNHVIGASLADLAGRGAREFERLGEEFLREFVRTAVERPTTDGEETR